jgi:hypothetical protein
LALAFALAACQASNSAGAGSGATSGASSGAGGSGAQTSGGSSGGAGSTSGASSTGSPESSGATGVTSGSGTTVTDAGTADGTATDAGAADGDSAAALTLTLPVEQQNGMDVLAFGPLKFTVNPMVGARIVSFTYGGDELLTDMTENASFYGSTLWTSPASDWVGGNGVQPPPALDLDPYTTTVSSDGVITATSGLYTTMNNKKFTLTKVFTPDLANQAIVIDYTITNAGTTAFQISHWEVTRVFPNGITFFPAGNNVKVNFLQQPMNLQQSAGYTWYDGTTHIANQGESKAGSDSMGGFIAQVARQADGDLLFIKAFKAITPAESPPAPDNFAIELYASDPPTYEELEDYSAYQSVAAGASYTQTVHWYLRRLPMETDAGVGNAGLIAAVQAVLAN